MHNEKIQQGIFCDATTQINDARTPYCISGLIFGSNDTLYLVQCIINM